MAPASKAIAESTQTEMSIVKASRGANPNNIF